MAHPRAFRVLSRTLLPVFILLTAGCATYFTKEYYLFSGRIFDERDKSLPFAAVYIAETPEDFYKPPRVYSHEVLRGNADVSARLFGREKANRLLYFRADDNGKFQTVWRRDVIQNRPLFFPKKPLHQIAFAVGLPGRSQRIVSFEKQASAKPFVYGDDSVRLKPNILPPITLEPGDEVIAPPVSIDASLLRLRYPEPPSGEAREMFKQGEKAFAERNFREALQRYNEALEKSPGHPLILMTRLNSHYRLGEYVEVLEKGERDIKLCPEYGFLHKIIADAALQSSRWELNRQHLIKAHQLDPEFPHSYSSLWQLDPRFAVVPKGWLPPSRIYHNTR